MVPNVQSFLLVSRVVSSSGTSLLCPFEGGSLPDTGSLEEGGRFHPQVCSLERLPGQLTAHAWWSVGVDRPLPRERARILPGEDTGSAHTGASVLALGKPVGEVW